MPTAAVIGGGIGGLTAALALRRAGWDVAVHERAPELREVGAGLTVWTNAVRVLRTLGVGPAVGAVGVPLARSELRSWRGRLLTATDLGGLEHKFGAPTLGVHRADLQAALADAVGRQHIRLGRTCVGYAQDATTATARFADGSEAVADLVVGADGIKSAVRGQMLGDELPRYAGYTAWRGVGRIDHPDVPLGTTALAMGKGSQVGFVPIGRGRLYWFATANVPEGEADPPGGHKAALLARFGDWYRTVPAAIEATAEADIVRNNIVDRPPVRRWADGRVALLGDAAHPTTPNLGQGACMAVESGFVLARALSQTADVPAALRSYEAARFERTALVTNRSWALGKLLALEGRAACWARDTAFRLLGRQSLRSIEAVAGVEV